MILPTTEPIIMNTIVVGYHVVRENIIYAIEAGHGCIVAANTMKHAYMCTAIITNTAIINDSFEPLK